MDILLFLTGTALFLGASPPEIQEMLDCLDTESRRFSRGETVFRLGEVIQRLGLVLSGGITIENDDVWGNRSILSHIGPGQVFGDTYACIPGEPLMVNAVAAQVSEVLFLNVRKLLEGGTSCGHQGVLIRNLLAITARKNLTLSRRIFYTSSKTIRGRLLSYLSDQAVLQGSASFSIPFDRQQLADYLGVDRSALSHELGKMQRDGLLTVRKNRFQLQNSIL